MFHHKGLNTYGGNVKFVAEEIIKQNLNCKIYWYVQHKILTKLKLTKKNNYGFPKEIKVIYNKRDLKRIAKKARVILTDNYFIGNSLLKDFKKTNQFIINTWHGSLGIKKIDLFTSHLNSDAYKSDRKKEFEAIDVMVSNSEWESEIYKNDLQFNNTIKTIGHPKNDIFFIEKTQQDKIREKVCNEIRLDKDKKIVLFAPTFRTELKQKYITTCFLQLFDLKAMKEAFDKYFNCDVQVILRLHPDWKFAKYLDKFIEEHSFITNATSYQDAQELLVATDAMVTDYSSTIFDFLFTKKPGFIFAPDRKIYEMTRGLYFPLEESPFPVAEDNETLVKNIINFDNDLYKKRVEEFLKSRKCVDDGRASERLVELIKAKMGVS